MSRALFAAKNPRAGIGCPAGEGPRGLAGCNFYAKKLVSKLIFAIIPLEELV